MHDCLVCDPTARAKGTRLELASSARRYLGGEVRFLNQSTCPFAVKMIGDQRKTDVDGRCDKCHVGEREYRGEITPLAYKPKYVLSLDEDGKFSMSSFNIVDFMLKLR